MFALNSYQTLAVGILLYYLGKLLKQKIKFLQTYCIPNPVIGGVLFALLNLALFEAGTGAIKLDTVQQSFFMNMFFTSVGFSASYALLKKGGRDVFILTIVCAVLITFQNIIGVGVFFFVLLLALLYICQHADITQISDLLTVSLGSKGHVTPYELTLIFTIFVMTHFWYMFNARAYNTGGSGLNLKGCDGFVSIALIILLGQIAIVQVPLFNTFFNVVPLSLSDWFVIIILSSLVMIVREAYSLAKRLFHSGE